MRDKLQKTNISLYCEARQFVNNLLLLIVGVLIFTIIGDSGPSTFDLILIITFVAVVIILISHNARGHSPYLLIKIYITANVMSWIPATAKDVRHRIYTLLDSIKITDKYDLNQVDEDYYILTQLRNIVDDIVNRAIIDGETIHIVIPEKTTESDNPDSKPGRCYTLSREDMCGLIVDFENLLTEIKFKLASVEPMKLIHDRLITGSN